MKQTAEKLLAPDEVIAVFAHVLSSIGLATTMIGGRVGFRVHGEGGGDWVVDLRVPGGAWSRPDDPEVVERCDATLYSEGEAFSHLITDPDQLVRDAKSGDILVAGDRARMERLGRLLSNQGGMLQQRISDPTTSNGRNKRK